MPPAAGRGCVLGPCCYTRWTSSRYGESELCFWHTGLFGNVLLLRGFPKWPVACWPGIWVDRRLLGIIRWFEVCFDWCWASGISPGQWRIYPGHGCLQHWTRCYSPTDEILCDKKGTFGCGDVHPAVPPLLTRMAVCDHNRSQCSALDYVPCVRGHNINAWGQVMMTPLPTALHLTTFWLTLSPGSVLYKRTSPPWTLSWLD